MNRLDQVKEKFPKEYKQAIKVKDASGNNKYLLWIAKQIQNKHKVPDITSTIEFFHNNTDRFNEKDIHKYKDLKELEDIIKDMTLSKTKQREEDKKGAVKIFEDDEILVVRCDDRKSIQYYGSNTKWCITSNDASYFEEYVDDGCVFYIAILKPKSKLGVKTYSEKKNSKAKKSIKFAFSRNSEFEVEIFDEKDNNIYLDDYVNKVPPLRKAYAAIISRPLEGEYQGYVGFIRKLSLSNSITDKELENLLKMPKTTAQELLSNSCSVDLTTNQKIKLLEVGLFAFTHYNFKKTLKEMSNAQKELLKKFFLSKDAVSDNFCLSSFINVMVLSKFLSPDELLIIINNFSNDSDLPFLKRVILENLPKTKEYNKVAESLINDKDSHVFILASNRLSIESLIELRKSKRGKRRKEISQAIYRKFSKDGVNIEEVIELIGSKKKQKKSSKKVTKSTSKKNSCVKKKISATDRA